MDDWMNDPRIANAPLRLRLWFERVVAVGFDKRSDREAEFDRIYLTTRLLDYLMGANGWSHGQVVPQAEAWSAIQRFDALHLIDRRKVDRRFAELDKDGMMRSAVRDLAFRVLTHQI